MIRLSQQCRLKFIDPYERIAGMCGFMHIIERDVASLRGGTVRVPQMIYGSLATAYEDIAEYFYFFGHPLEEVHEAIQHSAFAALEVFKLRGTANVFPVYEVTLDPDQPWKSPKSTAEFKPVRPLDTKDFSTTNSRQNLRYVCNALAAGEFAQAATLSSLAWDPPDADYVFAGGKYEICTPNDQQLAYAMKAYFAGELDGAEQLLRRVRALPKDAPIVGRVAMIRALCQSDADLFLSGLEEYLAWHDRQAKRKDNDWRTEFYLSLPGVGLCAFAVKRGVVVRDQLPSDNVFLPLGLIDLALAQREQAEGATHEFRVFSLPAYAQEEWARLQEAVEKLERKLGESRS